MAFCGLCGEKNEEGALFCRNCGSKQEVIEPKTAKEEINSSKENLEPNPGDTNYVENPGSFQQNPYQNQSHSQYPQPNFQPKTTNFGAQPFDTPYPQPTRDNKFDNGLYLIAFLVFPVGLILYYNHRLKNPEAAKKLLIASILGIFLWAIFI